MSSDESSDSGNEMSERRRPSHRYPTTERRRRVRVAENGDSEDGESSSSIRISSPQSSASTVESSFTNSSSQSSTSTSSIESSTSMSSLIAQLSHLIQEATETLATQYNSSEPEALICQILDLNPKDPNAQVARSDEASGSQQPMSTAVSTLQQGQRPQSDFTIFALLIILILMFSRYQNQSTQ